MIVVNFNKHLDRTVNMDNKGLMIYSIANKLYIIQVSLHQ